MSAKPKLKQAKLLNHPDIGEIILFTDKDAHAQRGELRQISHDGNSTYISIIDPDYDTNRNYDFPEFELEHETVIVFEEQK